MEFKVIISDPSGKSYQREIKEPEASGFRNKRIGDEFEGKLIGLEGYKLKITGGSDKSGFPMKPGLHKPEGRILMKEGVGYRKKRRERKRKRLIGEFITENTVQINTKVVEKGKKEIEELLGIKKEEKEETKTEEKSKEESSEMEKSSEEKEEKKSEVKEEKPPVEKAKLEKKSGKEKGGK